MNENEPPVELAALKEEHRRLDQQIAELTVAGAADQMEIARLKKRKLMLKDKIARVIDSSIPDIIA